MTNTTIIESAVARWTDPQRRPLFKGRLIDDSGDKGGAPGAPDGPCMCAQGDILFNDGGWPLDKLRSVSQAKADEAVADLLGISITHAILLRHVNDGEDGCPQDVLLTPERFLGDRASYILAFWLHIDRMSADQWRVARDARVARVARVARDAWDAWDARVARVAWDAWDARDARDIAFCAVAECAGIKFLAEHEKGEFVFLPMFGFADPEAVLAAASA